jgi:hypothetical protein
VTGFARRQCWWINRNFLQGDDVAERGEDIDAKADDGERVDELGRDGRRAERPRLIERLAAAIGDSFMSDQLSEFAWLLLDQARIVKASLSLTRRPSPDASRSCSNGVYPRRGKHDPRYIGDWVDSVCLIATYGASVHMMIEHSAECRRLS